MNRRFFLNQLKTGVLGISFGALSLTSCKKENHQKSIKNWLWYRPKEKFPLETNQEIFYKIKNAGIDAIFPEVYNSWEARYRSKHLPSNSDWMERLIPMAKKSGLEVHAWMWSMICNIPEIYENNSQWFGVNGNGKSTNTDPAYVDYYKFMCPNHPGVQEFVQKTAAELASFPELDGVHFDYIRYPDVILAESLQPKYNIIQDREYPEYDYCYCDNCRKLFQEQSGIDLYELKDPAQSKEWRQFRYDSITNLVNNKLIPTVRNEGKIVTAAVFPNWQHVRQNWAEWDLDAALPMLYNGFYNKGIDWIKEKTIEGVKSLGGKTKLYSGLYIQDLTPTDLIKAMEACLEGGAAGVSIFSVLDMTDEHWKAVAEFTNLL